MENLGTPVYHQCFFEDIVRTFSESAIFVVVTVDGLRVATTCLLGSRDTLEVPWGGLGPIP